jgi:uncharacterized protein (TIGR00290 family)
VSVVGLLTAVTAPFGRVSIHGVREELLAAQAEAVGLPLTRIELPYPCPNAVYEERMSAACAHFQEAGVDDVAFGDLFLEDVRAYRERRLQGTGLTPRFPLWGRDTRVLAREMIEEGFRAIIVCLDPARVPSSFAGREFDRTFLDDLPAGVDPCGENGEFHTFVYDGPNFASPLEVARGVTVERDGYRFVDLRPAGRRRAG